MGKGFFAKSELLKDVPPPSLVAECHKCGLYKTCRWPKMKPTGKGRKRILIIGEAPGAEEDREGEQFVGKTGRYLEDRLAELDVDMRLDCRLENALRCRPENNFVKDERTIDYCRPNVRKTIEEFDPELIIPLGARALRSLLGIVWGGDVGEIGRWVGYRIPCQKPNCWICPNWHPSHIVRDKSSERSSPVLEKFFIKYLKQALELEGRPWETVPDYQSRVRIILDPEQAAHSVDFMWKNAGQRPIAFDYETDHLKPDRKEARIVCCSMSDGRTSIAFPWMGAVIGAFRRFVRSDVRKIAANMKFETRWTRKVLREEVNNWYWDTMLAAHCLDNRSGTKSLKFQAFARLGFPLWNKHIEKFLEADYSNEPNHIKDVGLRDLLTYCALDSLLEWEVARLQVRLLK